MCGGARKQATAAALRVRVHARARVCAGPCIQVPWRAVRFKGRGGGQEVPRSLEGVSVVVGFSRKSFDNMVPQAQRLEGNETGAMQTPGGSVAKASRGILSAAS